MRGSSGLAAQTCRLSTRSDDVHRSAVWLRFPSDLAKLKGQSGAVLDLYLLIPEMLQVYVLWLGDGGQWPERACVSTPQRSNDSRGIIGSAHVAAGLSPVSLRPQSQSCSTIGAMTVLNRSPSSQTDRKSLST